MALSKTTALPLIRNPADQTPDGLDLKLDFISSNPQVAAEQFKLHLGYLQRVLQVTNRQDVIDALIQDPSTTPFQRRMLMEFLDGGHKEPSHRDELTGMLTRASLLARYSHQKHATDNRNSPLVVYFIDLDGFKRVNDQHGHAIGDRVLTAVGARIQGAIRPTDMAVRWGGDEFIVVFEGVREPDLVIQLAARLLRIITAPLQLDSDHSIKVVLGVSIGIAIGADKTISISDLIDQADRAMYQAKKAGENSIHIFP
jgi:diguanylate cyclase (GGDEF)-like protein